MKFLVDFFPVLLFFIAYKLTDIFVATGVAIAAAFVQVGWTYYQQRRVENTQLLTLAILIVFGGATLVLQDELFIKWKPTVLNWLMAVVFLGSQFIGKKITVIERMMGKSLTLPAAVWLKLNWSWVGFFVLLGAINIYVLYSYDTPTWVNFKLFGMFGLTLGFALLQGLYLTRYAKPEAIPTQPDREL